MSVGSFAKGLIHSASKYGFSATDAILGTDFMGEYNSQKNFNFQREQFEYQKALQQQLFAREDNAVQRRMKDLKAAGMNPLLAAGGAAGSGQAVTVSAPQVANNSFADRAIAKARADADISMTKAQQELINEQTQQARKQNVLTQKTIDWYDNHPRMAPGVDVEKTAASGIQNIGHYIGEGVRRFFRRGKEVTNDIKASYYGTSSRY